MHLTRPIVVCLCSLAMAATIPGPPAAAEPAPTAPAPDAFTVGLWQFQEGRGRRTASAIGGPAGILNGAVWALGRHSYAVSTHAGYVSIPDDPALRPARAITVEVWAKLAQASGDLVCKNPAYMIRLGSAMSAYFGVDGAWRVVTGRRPVPTGRWTHLAITYDSATRTAALYIDGVLDTRQEIRGLTAGLLDQPTSELRVGANTWAPMGSLVDGKVDMLRISNVARHFDAPPPAPLPAPVPGNLVPNGGFELGLMGWRLAGEGDAELYWRPLAHTPASGRLCLATLPDGQGTTLYSPPVPARPGTRYVLSARMRSDRVGGRAVLAALATGLASEAGARSFRRDVTLTNDWQQVTHPVELSEDWAAPSLCVAINSPQDVPLWVDDVRLVAREGGEAAALRERLGVCLPNPPVGHVYPVGPPRRVLLQVVNGDTRPHRVTVRASLHDWEGRRQPWARVGTAMVPPHGTRALPFRLDTRQRGACRLSFELTTEGYTWRQGAEFKYAVVLPLKGKGDAEASAFGMNTHMEREPTPHLARNLGVLSECGVKWIRGWWGWGMCEKERGQFDWTEYDRQLAAVEAAGMRLMPILLRYYPQYEREWAGRTDKIQRPPYRMDEWSAFVRKVVERYRGRVTAWEVWNEPTDGDSFTPELYASLLRATASPIRELDSRATIVGFAGVDLGFMRDTLALGTASTMDVVSEHSYSQLGRPEDLLTSRMQALRKVLADAGAEKPVWHTEQGAGADGDGYRALSLSEADVAALYTRNMVVARSLGIAKYFWFSAQTSPTYGWGVFFEDYIPRPRLVALNACASFLEGTRCQRSYRTGRNGYAYLFRGATTAGVVWNLDAPAHLWIPMPSDAVRAFDLMGNPLPVSMARQGCVIRLAADRPAYLQPAARYTGRFERALAAARVAELPPVGVAARRTSDGRVLVRVVCQAQTAQDGVVQLEVQPGAPVASLAPRHFHSLSPGAARSFVFAGPAAGRARQVRVRVGDRQIRTVSTPIP